MFAFFKKLKKRFLRRKSTFARKVLDDLYDYPLWDREVKSSPLGFHVKFSHPKLNYTIEWSVSVGWFGELYFKIPANERFKINNEISSQIRRWKEIQAKK